MKTFKSLLLLFLSLSFFSCASAQTNKRPMNEIKAPVEKTPINEKLADKNKSDAVKIIAEGSYESLETPFIFVARSEETYSQLQKIVAQLPSVKEIDFTKSAVVAAFAGQKNSGGYSISVKKINDKISIELIAPPSDAMTTSALTTPFVVATVPVEQGNFLTLEAAENWKSAIQEYKITSNSFETSGGIAGRMTQFKASGRVGVLTAGEYATVFFDLVGNGAESKRRLVEIASGTLQNGEIKLAQINAGSFAENPKPPLKATGKLSDKNFSLKIESLPPTFADGFQVSGNIEAIKAKNQKNVPANQEIKLNIQQ